MSRLVVIVDDPDNMMDSGCVTEILEEAATHGTVVEAYWDYGKGAPRIDDLMHCLEYIDKRARKC